MWGAVIGAVALTTIQEFLRASADYMQLVYGAILVIMMRVRPQGIIGEKMAGKSFSVGDSILKKLSFNKKTGF